MAFAVAAATVVLVLAIRLVSGLMSAADTFCEGVYVNGVHLGGMRYEEGVQAVVDGLDNRLGQESYVLTYQGREWPFTPSALGARLEADVQTQIDRAWNIGRTGTADDRREAAAYVKDNPVHYDTAIVYDEAKLEEFLKQIKAQVDAPPVEAEVKLGQGEQIIVTQSRDGLVLAVDDLRESLGRAIREGTAAAIELEPRVQPPVHSTQDLLNNAKEISRYSTSTKGSKLNRVKNIKRALSFFNAVTVQVGETVSFNDVVGKRTKANKFFKAPEYDGTQLKDGIGGGSCQASTTLYCALMEAGVDVSVRSPHRMTVSYTGPSLDAAVSDKKDLRFTNTLDYPIYIYTHVDTEKAEVAIYGPPSEYRIVLENKILYTKSPTKRKLVDDISGKHVYYKDEEPVFKEEGRDEVRSQGFRVYYDRVTGEEVYRQELEIDTYYQKQPVYWRGVHVRGAEG